MKDDALIWCRDLPILLADVYEKTQSPLPPKPELRLIDVIEWLGRIPSRRTRRIYFSDVLTHERILSPYELSGIRQLCSAMAWGGSILSFLGDTTASIRRRSNNDRKRKWANHDIFFADWGLLHFHLGADLEGKGGRVMRSRRVLIARLTDDAAYLIDVVPHGRGFGDLWGKIELLETLYRNWPETIDRFELKGILPGKQHSAADYIALRRSGVSVPITLAGKMFLTPGFGISMDGSSVLAVERAITIRRELDYAEEVYAQQHATERAILFISKNASVGFFNPDTQLAVSVLHGRKREHQTTLFFERLNEETGILDSIPEGAIWTPAAEHSTSNFS